MPSTNAGDATGKWSPSIIDLINPSS
jgi:hypothetical protein